MTALIAWFRLRYWLHQWVHGVCQKREQQNFWAGYLKGLEDERSLRLNVKLEQDIRDAIARAGW